MAKFCEPDTNETAAQIVRQSTAKAADKLPAEVEAARGAWIGGIGEMDARARALLRTAFEVGVAAGKTNSH